jgi:hypothetical protein
VSGPISKDNAEWRSLKMWLSKEIVRLQRDLESADPLRSERAHDVTRGEIAAYRRLIREVEPTPLLEAEKVEAPVLDESVGY